MSRKYEMKFENFVIQNQLYSHKNVETKRKNEHPDKGNLRHILQFITLIIPEITRKLWVNKNW